MQIPALVLPQRPARWFAEAREASVHDDAEVKTWKVARQSGRKRGLFES